uniref:Protein kinase domain-containing protein n=1 Tax=Guillardia theta TaxID=55529 RepID=A0A7S4P0M5_GUITH|mmetsp:Transcript_4070/g.15072  ORF Transcript_4070/g.15072 Transcript_4070/m.15072 type:complete len:692 (+) Transcript_4070:938-3013(+)
MVRCMRKGHGALECPVCLQLFNRPVTPVNAECRCTFCESCFVNLVKFGGRCTKCGRGLPRDPMQAVVNAEVLEAIQAFQQYGGEDAEYATLMTGLKGKPDRPKYQILNMEEFKLDPKPLASGAYGQVFRGTWLKQNLPVAVKKVLRTSVMSREQTIESFRKEAEILAMLDHPHVLKLYGAVLDEENICIVTELVPGGSLFDLIHTKPLLKPEAVIAISTGVCKGMTYLHSMGIIHRDLKPGNLLMGAVASPSGPQLVVKVADFGLARVQDSARTMTGGIGTSQYTAPEVLRSERYDHKADVYSFGVILWEIHARKIPYSEMNQMQIAVAVATQDQRPPPPKNCPAPFWQLMQHCWQTRPHDRPSFPEVLSQLEDMQFVFNLAASAHGSIRASSAMRQQQSQQNANALQQQKQLAEQQMRMNNLQIDPHARQQQQQQQQHSPAANINYSPQSPMEHLNTPPAEAVSPNMQYRESKNLYVPEMFATISEAIANAQMEDQIFVSPGHYVETISIRNLTVSIVGNGNMQNILLEGPTGAMVISQEGGLVRISNLMIRSADAPAYKLVGGQLIMEDCNVSGGKMGLWAYGGCECCIRRSVICRCDRQGMYLGEKCVAVVESCSIFENGDHGILVLNDGARLSMTRSMVSYNQGAAVAIDQFAGGKVENNDLRNNMQGPCLVGVQSQNLVSVTNNLT